MARDKDPEENSRPTTRHIVLLLFTVVVVAIVANIAFEMIADRLRDRLVGTWPILASVGLMLALAILSTFVELMSVSEALSLRRPLTAILGFCGRLWDWIQNRWPTTPHWMAKSLGTVRHVVTFPFVLAWRLLGWTWGRLKVPKWYRGTGAIDPGLIEVSLAITAVIIAVPAFGSESGASYAQLGFFRPLFVVAEFISTYVSITLINLYAKDRGSTSIHVLLGPIVDGPFFLLSWAVILGFLIISVVAVDSWQIKLLSP